MTTGIDKKVLERVRKLLALAADGGATEAEAQLAAERARQIMAENGISNATIEAAGGEGEARVAGGRKGHTGKRWMREIMRALAKQSFVEVDYDSGGMRYVDGYGYRKVAGHWELWGRESAVITVRMMHEYLVRTVDRVARERGTPTDETFKEAMGRRIAERIEERHDDAMAQQEREAREKRAQAMHPAAATGNALVVVLTDYAQQERDLNNDLRMGWKPGTTAERRELQDAERAQRIAQREAELEEQRATRQRLLDDGIDADVVAYMMDGFTQEQAERMVARERSPEGRAKAERERARQAKSDQQWSDRYYREQEKLARKMNSPSYRAGRAAGNNVGLDAQVDKKEQRKLS